MKKIRAAAIFVFIIIISITAISAVYAQESGVIYPNKYFAHSPGVEDFPESFDEDAFRDHVYEKMMNFERKIDISSFNIPVEMSGTVADFIEEELVECFQCGIYSFTHSDRFLLSVNAEYYFEKSQWQEKKAEWDAVVEEFVGDVKDNDALSDVQKALILHDRVALYCEYDVRTDAPFVSHSAYSVVFGKTAVCQGYANFYKYLLEQVGIKVDLCSSSRINHVWNIVYIDGVGYHVDVTWDDPINDISGRVNHDNFLCSSEKFVESHGATDFNMSPSDKKYDDYFWNGSMAAFILLGDEIYYIDGTDGELRRYDGKEILEIEEKWKASLTSTYRDYFTRLAQKDGVIFYTTPDAIYGYDPETGKTQLIEKPQQNYGNLFFIYGFYYEDGYFYAEYNDYPNFDVDTKEKYTKKIEAPASYTVSYDANGGETAPRAQKKIKGFDDIISEAEPEREGYEFMGWAKEADGAVKYALGETYKENADVTLYAVWKKTTVSVAGVELDKTTATLFAGEKLTLKARVLPENATNKNVIWISSDTSVAEVEDGVVTAKKAGEVTITAKTVDGELTAICRITIKKIKEDGDPTLKIGDVNGDDDISTKDVVLLAQFVAKWKVRLNETAADCNGDGTVDIKDIVILAQFLAKWQVTFG